MCTRARTRACVLARARACTLKHGHVYAHEHADKTTEPQRTASKQSSLLTTHSMPLYTQTSSHPQHSTQYYHLLRKQHIHSIAKMGHPYARADMLEEVTTAEQEIYLYGVSEAHRQGFSLGTPVSSPPSSVNGFSQ